MTDFVRRLVSGNKARFKDDDLKLELDLVYITDQVIVMGYPAVGLEGLYRNRREDAKKFLEHRHGKNFWVFNFCPARENSYDADVFDGRVSRYPFPDHHAPPLAILALVAREMRVWLEGSPERVAVLHCKAGKGRSGTLACSYLLTLDAEPTAPSLPRSYNKKQWKKMSRTLSPAQTSGTAASETSAQPLDENSTPTTSANNKESLGDVEKKENALARAETLMDEMPSDDGMDEPETAPDTDGEDGESAVESTNGIHGPSGLAEVDMKLTKSEQKVQEESLDAVKNEGIKVEDHAQDDSPAQEKTVRVVESPDATGNNSPTLVSKSKAASKQSTLSSVLNLHTSRRMRRESESSSSSSSSSSSLSSSSSSDEEKKKSPKKPKQGVSIPSQRRWLLFWSMLLADEGPQYFWPPLPHPPTSPYHEQEPIRPRVRLLEMKVRLKEDRGMKVSVVKAASQLLDRLAPKKVKGSVAGEGGTDMSDLWCSLARYDDEFVDVLEKWERWSREAGVGGMGRRRKGGEEMPALKRSEVEETPEKLQDGIKDLFKDDKWDKKKMVRSFAKLGPVAASETRDNKIITQILRAGSGGVVLDSNREVRFKLYMGKVFMTWLWIIPAFLLPPLPTDPFSQPDPVTLTFAKSDCDFAIGLGSDIIDIQMTFQQIMPDAPSSPPPRQESGESDTVELKRAGVVGNVVGAIEKGTGVDIREGVEINQAQE